MDEMSTLELGNKTIEGAVSSTSMYSVMRHVDEDIKACDPTEYLTCYTNARNSGSGPPGTSGTSNMVEVPVSWRQQIIKVEVPKMELPDEDFSTDEVSESNRENANSINDETSEINQEAHLSSSVYKCSFCDSFFTDEISLATHESLHDNDDSLLHGEQMENSSDSDEDFNPEENDQVNDYLSKLKGNGEFTCDKCPQSFPRQHLLKVHAFKVHGDKAFPCLICGEKCPSRRSLTKHKQVHVVDGAFKCETCGFSQLKYSNFLRHLKLHTGTRDYTCEWCGKSFTTSTVLIRHRRRHTGEKPYSCEECGERFSRLYGLRVHQSKHVGRGYKCNQENCSKAFYSKSALNNHLKSHLPERPYKCVACGLGFYMISHYKDHIRTHTGEKPFLCKECGKAFGRKGELSIHERTHTGERPYVCTFCNKGFAEKGVLKHHLLTHTNKKVNCNECSRSFKHELGLRRHQKVAHSHKEKCETSSDSSSGGKDDYNVVDLSKTYSDCDEGITETEGTTQV